MIGIYMKPNFIRRTLQANPSKGSNMKSHIEKTLSHLYREHGENTTIIVNGLLMSFETQDGELKLFVYNNADYDSFQLELNRTDEFPIIARTIDKAIADKILGLATKDQL